MNKGVDILFNERAGWEQNKLKHSPDRLILSRISMDFIPSSISLLGKHVTIPLNKITNIKPADNILLGGVVKINLSSDIEGRRKYIFFLGGKSKRFLSICQQLGMYVS